MAIGTALALVAVGAILAYAVDVEVPGIDVGTVGAILFWVGLLGLAVTIGLETAAQRARHPRPRRVAAREPEERPVAPPPAAPAPYDPVVGPPAPRPRTPPVEDPADKPTRVADRRRNRS